MNKIKKYRVILDFFDDYQADTEALKQEDPELDDETAERIAYDDLCDYLTETLTSEIDHKAPHGLAIFADLGLWNGRRSGIKIVDSFRDVLKYVDDVMYLTIETTSQGIEVTAPHHDGTNVYTVRALTEAGANRYSDYDDELEESLIHGSPRTVRRYTRRITNLFE